MKCLVCETEASVKDPAYDKLNSTLHLEDGANKLWRAVQVCYDMECHMILYSLMKGHVSPSWP